MLSKRGAGQQLFDIVKRLPSHINVHIFGFSDSDGAFPEFVGYERVKMYSGTQLGKYNILKAKPLLDCLSDGNYDVIITVGTGMALFLGRICAILCGIPIIYSELHTFHNLNRDDDKYFEIPNRIINVLFPKIPGRRIYKFLPVCRRLCEKIRLTVDNYPVETLYNGIASEDIAKIMTYEPAERTKSALDQIATHPTVVQVGTLDQNKNQIFTLKCVKVLKSHIPDVRCLLIGEGDKKTELTNWVISNNLTDHVIFTGHIDRMDCLYLMSKSDVLVLTSHSEAFPIVLIEAQGLSIPIVTLDVGGASETVQDGVTGYLIQKGAEETFQQRLMTLLVNQNLARKMGRSGRQRVIKNFTIEKRIQKLVSMVEKDLHLVQGAE